MAKTESENCKALVIVSTLTASDAIAYLWKGSRSGRDMTKLSAEYSMEELSGWLN